MQEEARCAYALYGALGRDTFIGSSGDDKFVYKSDSESRVGKTSRDVITDFNRGTTGEKVGFSAIDAYTKTAGN